MKPRQLLRPPRVACDRSRRKAAIRDRAGGLAIGRKATSPLSRFQRSHRGKPSSPSFASTGPTLPCPSIPAILGDRRLPRTCRQAPAERRAQRKSASASLVDPEPVQVSVLLPRRVRPTPAPQHASDEAGGRSCPARPWRNAMRLRRSAPLGRPRSLGRNGRHMQRDRMGSAEALDWRGKLRRLGSRSRRERVRHSNALGRTRR